MKIKIMATGLATNFFSSDGAVTKKSLANTCCCSFDILSVRGVWWGQEDIHTYIDNKNDHFINIRYC